MSCENRIRVACFYRKLIELHAQSECLLRELHIHLVDEFQKIVDMGRLVLPLGNPQGLQRLFRSEMTVKKDGFVLASLTEQFRGMEFFSSPDFPVLNGIIPRHKGSIHYFCPAQSEAASLSCVMKMGKVCVMDGEERFSL